MSEPCIQSENVGRLLEGYEGLIRWQTAQNGTLRDIKTDVKEIREAVSTVQQNLNSRPSWSTSLIITMLSTLCAGLAVYLLTRG